MQTMLLPPGRMSYVIPGTYHEYMFPAEETGNWSSVRGVCDFYPTTETHFKMPRTCSSRYSHILLFARQHLTVHSTACTKDATQVCERTTCRHESLGRVCTSQIQPRKKELHHAKKMRFHRAAWWARSYQHIYSRNTSALKYPQHYLRVGDMSDVWKYIQENQLNVPVYSDIAVRGNWSPQSLT